MKRLEMTICNCYECPFSEYDSHYTRSYDSGYDCKKSNDRIANDYEMTAYDKKMDEIKAQNETLFKYDGEMPRDPMSIPDWCELDDK